MLTCLQRLPSFKFPTPFRMGPSEIWQASDSQRMSDGISEYTPESMPDRMSEYMSEYMSDRWGSHSKKVHYFCSSPRPTCETGCSKAHAMGGRARKTRSALNSADKIRFCFSLAI